jgi:hypothetical protein
MLAGFDDDITSIVASGMRVELIPDQRLLRLLGPASEHRRAVQGCE